MLSNHQDEEYIYLTNNFLDVLLGMWVYTYPFRDFIEISIDRPRGFIVSEIVNGIDTRNIIESSSNYIAMSYSNNRYIYIVKKIGIDSFRLCKILKRTLYCSRCEILGLKDSDAIAYQTVILYSCKNIEKHLKLKIDEIIIEALLWDISNIPLIHNANKFELLIRIEYNYKDIFRQRLKFIERYGNLILNFFGYQRFGSRRPVSHLIGKQIVRNDWEKAFNLICNYPFPTENDIAIRRRITWMYGGHVHNNHSTLNIEDICIYRYEDPFNAIKHLQKEIITFFINSYQSYLFNVLLSKLWIRLISNYDLLRALGILYKDYRYLPIIGYQTRYFKPEIKKIIDEILEIEDINQESFCINALKICEKGDYRESLTKIYDISYSDINEYIKLSFVLPPGSYATIVLREIARCNPILYT